MVAAAGDLVLLANAGDGGLVRNRLLSIPKAAASEGYQDVIVADVGRNLVVTAFNDPRRLPANVARAPRGARVSIHSTRVHVAPATRAALFELRCSRGRGQCQGRLEIIADDRFGQQRVRVAAIATYNTGRRAAVLTGPTTRERRAACDPR